MGMAGSCGVRTVLVQLENIFIKHAEKALDDLADFVKLFRKLTSDKGCEIDDQQRP